MIILTRTSLHITGAVSPIYNAEQEGNYEH